ncbi:MAG: holin family protein [Candidatus Thorarchaeota archaeon]
MSFDPISAVLDLGSNIINKIFPDPSQRDKYKLELIKLQQEGEFKEVETRMSAILAEANSLDPWTSRARPSFLYVMYIMILAAIPLGILHAINPTISNSIAMGLKEWLAAIPKELYALFGVGYLGYTGARSYDKKLKAK